MSLCNSPTDLLSTRSATQCQTTLPSPQTRKKRASPTSPWPSALVCVRDTSAWQATGKRADTALTAHCTTQNGCTRRETAQPARPMRTDAKSEPRRSSSRITTPAPVKRRTAPGPPREHRAERKTTKPPPPLRAPAPTHHSGKKCGKPPHGSPEPRAAHSPLCYGLLSGGRGTAPRDRAHARIRPSTTPAEAVNVLKHRQRAGRACREFAQRPASWCPVLTHLLSLLSRTCMCVLIQEKKRELCGLRTLRCVGVCECKQVLLHSPSFSPSVLTRLGIVYSLVCLFVCLVCLCVLVRAAGRWPRCSHAPCGVWGGEGRGSRAQTGRENTYFVIAALAQFACGRQGHGRRRRRRRGKELQHMALGARLSRFLVFIFNLYKDWQSAPLPCAN